MGHNNFVGVFYEHFFLFFNFLIFIFFIIIIIIIILFLLFLLFLIGSDGPPYTYQNWMFFYGLLWSVIVKFPEAATEGAL